MSGMVLQVTDTPGLLDRPDAERNAMELLTLATLQHLPTAAIFVLDLTEECGCSIQEQWRIRTSLLQQFPEKLWIDVVSKADMLEAEVQAAAEAASAAAPGGATEPDSAVQAVCTTSTSMHITRSLCNLI